MCQDRLPGLQSRVSDSVMSDNNTLRTTPLPVALVSRSLAKYAPPMLLAHFIRDAGP